MNRRTNNTNKDEMNPVAQNTRQNTKKTIMYKSNCCWQQQWDNNILRLSQIREHVCLLCCVWNYNINKYMKRTHIHSSNPLPPPPIKFTTKCHTRQSFLFLKTILPSKTCSPNRTWQEKYRHTWLPMWVLSPTHSLTASPLPSRCHLHSACKNMNIHEGYVQDVRHCILWQHWSTTRRTTLRRRNTTRQTPSKSSLPQSHQQHFVVQKNSFLRSQVYTSISPKRSGSATDPQCNSPGHPACPNATYSLDLESFDLAWSVASDDDVDVEDVSFEVPALPGLEGSPRLFKAAAAAPPWKAESPGMAMWAYRLGENRWPGTMGIMEGGYMPAPSCPICCMYCCCSWA